MYGLLRTDEFKCLQPCNNFTGIYFKNMWVPFFWPSVLFEETSKMNKILKHKIGAKRDTKKKKKKKKKKQALVKYLLPWNKAAFIFGIYSCQDQLKNFLYVNNFAGWAVYFITIDVVMIQRSGGKTVTSCPRSLFVRQKGQIILLAGRE